MSLTSCNVSVKWFVIVGFKAPHPPALPFLLIILLNYAVGDVKKAFLKWEEGQ